MPQINLSGKLGKGQYTLVDNNSFEKYGHLAWHLSDTGYAVRRNKSEGGTIRLHRLITNAPEGMIVDHLNGNKLDNRASNLRVTTQLENARNRKNIKGYSYDKSKKRYMVRYRNKFYGRYATEKEAIEAYKKACSGVEYKKTRRKYYMLPKHISKQFGKYRVSIQKDGIRYRKSGINTLDNAISWRDKMYEKLQMEKE